MKDKCKLLIAVLMVIGIWTAPSQAAQTARPIEAMDWSFAGPFGTYDRNALRRGFQVYKEVCAACHGMKYLFFRNLSQAGGPEFSEAEVKAIAAEYNVEDGPDEFGDMYERSGLPRDRFIEPFPNQNAARAANSGAFPPDLSLIVKSYAGGADFIHALLTGYEDTPQGMQMDVGFYYNPYIEGEKIAMPPPLVDDLVEYADGTPATREQMSLDVTHFLSWASEPELEARHRIGFMVMIYLFIFAGLMYFSMRKIWSNQH